MNLNPVGWASSSLRLVARLFNSGVNSTVPVTAISEAPVGATNADISLVAKGTGATLAQVPDGTTVGGNKRGDNATDWQKSRTINSYVASGILSTIAGGQSNTASGTLATVGGGDTNLASGTRSTVAGGNSNTASSTYSFVGGGQSNTAQTNTHATVCGGNSNVASGQYSFVGGGNTNSATATNAVIAGGNNNSASTIASVISGGSSNSTGAVNATVCGGGNNSATGDYSTVAGGRYGTTRGIWGMLAMPACVVPIASTQGVTQSALLLLARETTTATATVLTSNSSAAGTGNQVVLPNNAAYFFKGSLIAGVTGGGDTAAWEFKGAIKRGATAASTAIVGATVLDRVAYDTNAASWTVAITADTTNGGIAVTVTGAASTTIRWVCKIETTEMTY